MVFYQMQLLLKHEKPTCHDYDYKKCDECEFNWNLIYKIPHIATYETKIRIFQYKLLNNVLHLKKKLFHFGIISQSKCSFCELYDETRLHAFYQFLCLQFCAYDFCGYAQRLSN